MTQNAPQNAPWSVKGIDPEARDAAKEAARRAGMTLGEWLNGVIAGQAGQDIASRPPLARPKAQRRAAVDHEAHDRVADRLARRPRDIGDTALDLLDLRRPLDDDRLNGSASSEALATIARWMGEAQARLDAATRLSSERQEQTAAAIGDALTLVTRRLDDIERRLEKGHRAAIDPLRHTVEQIEARLERLTETPTVAPETAPVEETLRVLEDRLAAMVQRMSEEHRTSPGGKARDSLAEPSAERAAGRSTPRPPVAAQPAEDETGASPSAGSRPVPQDRLSAAIAEIRGRQLDLERGATLGERFAAISRRLAPAPQPVTRPAEAAPNATGGATTANAPTVDPSAAKADEKTDAACRPDRDEAPATALRAESLAPPELGTIPGDIADRLEALSRKIEQALRPIVEAPFDQMLQRLDRIDAHVQSGPDAADIERLEDLIRSLAERIETVRAPGSDASALDALERQIAHLAARIDELAGAREGGPGIGKTLGTLERTMGDIVGHLEALHRGTAAAIEQAAQAAVADTLAGLPHGDPARIAEIDALQRDFGELRAAQDAADRRTQDTLEAVHDTLERVVERLALLEEDMAGKRRPPADGLAPQRDDAPRASIGRASLAPLTAADRPAPDSAALMDHDVPLEPGSGRPLPAPALAGASVGPPDPHKLKASFIAAARRAAQAAVAETSAAKAKGRASEPLSDDRGAGRKGASPMERLKNQLGAKRKPLLLGLAAIVLAVGAAQIVTEFLGRGQDRPAARSSVQSRDVTGEAPEGAPRQGSPKPAATEAGRAGPASAAVPPPNPFAAPDGPAITGSIKVAPERGATPAPAPLPDAAQTVTETDSGSSAIGPKLGPIPDMPAFAELPANVGSAGLRRAVLAGDPAAVYELASRLAEGRGMPRDLALAAKLFEKAAAHGLAPAQYRIASQYEKGLGVARDPRMARDWYERAAQAGNIKAMHNLAVLLAEGVNGKPDYAAAIGWFRKAAEHGVRDSQYNLAILLARGLGTQQNLVESHMWFALVAALGDEDAGRKRDEVASRLKPAELAAAKAAADQWRPRTPTAAANDVQAPEAGWDKTPSVPAKTSAGETSPREKGAKKARG
ncbi:hypothetical protein QNA08_07010 [Chelatococcus sp. SYSU_G07232]|uniref:Localization factor PodJL n=1 Tax=Chelatococcus albus TaxID=3047466 RepID=A0ABT7AF53_9HYPH|nr:hypothetical protein [Chelatococcus sp. SYSU_G07232]MDJ1157981.1 hypothetical protein [Chelatococcus sp. SYSU_G07232]